MNASTATECESLSALGPLRRLWFVSGAIVVLVVYSLPFVINHFSHGPFLNVAVEDEKIYLARVVDVYRGGSLGNPYLAEHQDAERIMPEGAERLLAFTAHLTGLSPLLFVDASRIVFPVLIYVLLWSFARSLGIEPRLAMLAGMLPPLVPSISRIVSTEAMDAGFFRYFRAISPAFSVLFLLLVLRLVQFAWRKGSLWTGALSGATLGLLFYVAPIYYWSFAIIGVACLALCSSGRARIAMSTSVPTASLVALPLVVKVLHQEHVPDVHDTLARLDLLTPGRTPDIHVTRSLLAAVVVLVPVWLWRRRLGDSGRFLFPFMCVGTVLMVQNVVTNRHLQSYHWVECLIPIWALAAVAFLQSSAKSLRPVYFVALIAVLVANALFLQTIAYVRWEELRDEHPEFWALDARMPHTLNWLNQHTQANSVVIADWDVMDSLVLFTHNKVYWADYAGQHVMPEWEVQARTDSLTSWHPSDTARLPFAADFYLGVGSVCPTLPREQLLYSNKSEGTCVLTLSREGRKSEP